MSDTASLSFYLKTNTIRIHLSTYHAIGDPKFIQFLIDPDLQTLLIKTHNRKTARSFRMPKFDEKPNTHIQIRSKPFCMALAQRMGWDANVSYRIPGKPYTVQGVAAFDLRNAKPITMERTVSR